MDRPAALLTALLLAVPAAAQVFTGVPGLGERLDAVRVRAQDLKDGTTDRRAMGRRDPSALPPVGTSGTSLPDVTPYPVKGMDVSHYEGGIDWDKVRAEAGLSFVYMKATESTGYLDPTFARNWAGASRVGLLKGAYHFYDFCKGGAAQAAWFVKAVPAEAGALPPVLDLEQSGSCPKLPPKAKLRADLAAFVAAMRTAYGRDPILYVNGSIYSAYLQGENDPYLLWFADVRHDRPQVPGDASWAFWQYDWHGHVPGISGETDLDVFRGTPAELAALAAGPSAVAGR